MAGFWYGIGDSPTADEIQSAATRYKVVVLNAWEAAKMRQIKAANPNVTVLVYKDFSSTRSYAGAVDNGKDAAYLPAGVGYIAAQNTNEAWFAHTAAGARIDWSPDFSGHWQMAVWDSGYQQAWADNVTKEVVKEGWDGVLADNDFAHLGYYTNKLVAPATTTAQSDQKLRDGLDGLLAVAGQRLNAAGKVLIPNLSESRLFPGRWASHSRFGGAMEEYLAPRDITVASSQWDEMLRQQSGIQLLVTHAGDADLQTGFAMAALLTKGNTSWMPASSSDNYSAPNWTAVQDVQLGSPSVAPTRETTGVWTRSFAGGWVAVNPTAGTVNMTAPAGLHTIDNAPASALKIPAGGSVVLLK